MGYDPTSKPSNQTATAAIDYKGQGWVFYYEASGELYVLKSTSGKKYTYEKVLDADGHPIVANDETHPIAVTSNSRYLQLYYVEKTTNYWKELLVNTHQSGQFSNLKLTVGSPATVSATTVDDKPKVYFTVQGTEPHFTVATYTDKGWIVETLETQDKASNS